MTITQIFHVFCHEYWHVNQSHVNQKDGLTVLKRLFTPTLTPFFSNVAIQLWVESFLPWWGSETTTVSTRFNSGSHKLYISPLNVEPTYNLKATFSTKESVLKWLYFRESVVSSWSEMGQFRFRNRNLNRPFFKLDGIGIGIESTTNFGIDDII